MEFEKSVLTQKGKQLLTKARAGLCKIQLTCARTGNGVYLEEELENLRLSINLKQERQKFAIQPGPEVFEDGQVCLRIHVNNRDLENGYYITEFGIFAKEEDQEDNEEILYAISIVKTAKADWIPPYDLVKEASFMINTFLSIANTDKILISEVPFDYAAQSSLLDHTQNLDIHITSEERDKWNVALDTAIDYTNEQITELIGGAPETLATLKELADSLEENQNIIETLNNAIGSKANQTDLEEHTHNKINHITATERNSWNAKQNAITIDDTLKVGSKNPIQNGVVNTAVEGIYSDIYRIDENIKPLQKHVENKDIHITVEERSKWDAKQNALTIDSTLKAGSKNPIQNGVVNTAVEGIYSNISRVDENIKPLQKHVENKDIHITSAERTKWESAYKHLSTNHVTGIKGAGESAYRNGQVNITAGNIGLGNVPNVATNDQAVSYTDISKLAELKSGEKMKDEFPKLKIAVSKVMAHDKLIGPSDISLIGNGTVTGALTDLKSTTNNLEMIKRYTINEAAGFCLLVSSNTFRITLGRATFNYMKDVNNEICNLGNYGIKLNTRIMKAIHTINSGRIYLSSINNILYLLPWDYNISVNTWIYFDETFLI